MVSLSPSPGLAMTPFLFDTDCDGGGGMSSLSLLATISLDPAHSSTNTIIERRLEPMYAGALPVSQHGAQHIEQNCQSEDGQASPSHNIVLNMGWERSQMLMKVGDLWVELNHIEGRQHVERQGD